MRLFRSSILSVAFICSAFFTHESFAAAFELYELGTPIIGTAGVGQAAIAADASTSYFNPAGMALLPDTEFMLGAQMMLPYIYFSPNTHTTIRGDNGGGAGSLTPGMDFYSVYSYNPCLKFGISVTSPYGGSLDYTDGWVGRFMVQDVLFYTINVNPSIAFRVNDWASLGAGLVVEYMNLTETVALPIPDLPLVDGQANVKLDSVSPGFNLGLMLNPGPATRIGLAFRSQVVHHLHGNTTFLRIGATPSTSTKMVMPSNLTLSAAQDLWCYGKLLGEVGWANWSSMRDSIVNISRYSVFTPLNWNNTYRVGLGGQFNATPDLILQAGVSYDSSPTKATRRIADLPMDRQIRVGAGVIYNMIKGVQLAASYEYMNFGKADIDNVSPVGVVSGSYSRNYINTLQISVNVATG